jgi:hypothetical protein
VNEEECSLCQSADCEEEPTNFVHKFSVECNNIPQAATLDGCIPPPDTAETVFAFLGESGYKECVPVQDSSDMCETTMKKTMRNADPSVKTICSCNEDTDLRYELSCADDTALTGCQYCDETRTICATYSQYSAMINQFGQLVSFTDQFEYTSGRNETLVLTDYGYGCTVSIDGKECQRCEIVDDCQEDGAEVDLPAGNNYDIDCSNALNREALFSCGEGDDVFLALSNALSYVCETSHPSSLPSSAPTPGPTVLSSIPSDMPSLIPSDAPSFVPTEAFGGMRIDMSSAAAATNNEFSIAAGILIIGSLQLLLFC